MSDLLKEAIADAKAVRETALQNAKAALEEAFTPHLKSMLSAKLAEDDMDDDDVDEFGHDAGDDEEEPEETRHEGEHDDEEAEETRHEGEHDEGHVDGHDDDDAEEGMHEDNIIEIDGVKYAPVMSEEEDDEKEETRHEEDLDLESVIKELESELTEEEDDDDKDETVEEEFEIDESLFEEEDDKEETVDEVDTSSAIGKGTGRGNTDTSSGIGTANKKLKEAQSELKEYKEAVKFLKDKLHEVNILNAKLLFTNKVFKEFALSNDQKMKVVENFDRAHTTREIKLVYTTLCENLTQTKNTKTKSINEGASVKSGSTKPSGKIITESDAVAERFKKLANIR